MKFLIPSKGRSDSVGKTVELFGKKNVLVYVAESERLDYEKQLGKTHVRTIPHGTFGMGAIREFILKQHLKEDFIFMVDDDVTGMEYKFTDKVTRIVDTTHILEVIQNAYQTSLDLGTPLFGFVSSPNPMLYTQLDHVHYNGMIACGIGIIPHLLGDVMFDPRMIVNEDQDFCLQVKHFHRFLFMDNRYNFRYGKTWVSEGGCSTLRNASIMQECRELLKKKYGKSVVRNSPKKDNQVILKVPF